MTPTKPVAMDTNTQPELPAKGEHMNLEDRARRAFAKSLDKLPTWTPELMADFARTELSLQREEITVAIDRKFHLGRQHPENWQCDACDIIAQLRNGEKS